MEKMNPVCWFEIYVDDMGRAKKFYSTVLACELEDLPLPEGDHASHMVIFPMVENGRNISGSLVQMKGMKAGSNSTVIYFACEDCAVEAGRVEAAGGKVYRPKFPIGQYGFCVWCVDTEGNYFGLHSLK